jgi:hypothetical protein
MKAINNIIVIIKEKEFRDITPRFIEVQQTVYFFI